MRSLSPESLTWTALLAKWVDFARSAVALPDDADGLRWRQSVPAVINLQAVTFALADLERIAVADRALARDRGRVLVAEQVAAIDAIWTTPDRPRALGEMIADARAAAEASLYAGTIAWVHEGDTPLVMPAVRIVDDRGTFAIMQPGTIAMPGTPVLWWSDRDEPPVTPAIESCRATPLDEPPPQVYREIDDDGRIVRDVIRSIVDEPAPGLPLLVPIAMEGRRIGRFTLDAETWETQQRAAMPEGGIAVVRDPSPPGNC